MTRTKTDTIIGIVGALAIVFTLIGVFAYEYNNVPDDGGNGGDGDPTQVPSQDHSGDLAQDGSVDLNFTPSVGVTAMDVTITWTPTAPGPLGMLAGGFSYELRDPDGTVVESGSSTESVSFDVPQPVAGEYILSLSAPSPSLGGGYEAEATYDYDAAST